MNCGVKTYNGIAWFCVFQIICGTENHVRIQEGKQINIHNTACSLQLAVCIASWVIQRHSWDRLKSFCPYACLCKVSLNTAFGFSCSIYHHWSCHNAINDMHENPWCVTVMAPVKLQSLYLSRRSERKSSLLYLNFTVYILSSIE